MNLIEKRSRTHYIVETNVKVNDVYYSFLEGNSTKELMDTFGLTRMEVEDALRFKLTMLRKQADNLETSVRRKNLEAQQWFDRYIETFELEH